MPYFHRTLSDWLNAICQTGFMIERLGEPTATTQPALAVPLVADTLVTPLFLHIRAGKPSATVGSSA